MTKYLVCGGVAWTLADRGEDTLLELRATIKEAVKERSIIYVTLGHGEQLLVNGARLECALLWDDHNFEAPPAFFQLPAHDFGPGGSGSSPFH
jgi:hypothetical protein